MEELKAPINQFAHMKAFPDPTFTDVVSPNADTDALYSMAAADGLSAYVTDESASQQGPCFWEDF